MKRRNSHHLCRIYNVGGVKRRWVLIIKQEILIVDDQPGIRLLLQDVFINEGYGVMVAHTGLEALEKIYEHSFDLVMLDYRLPILNGGEVLQKMTKDQIIIPVILMSGLIENIEGDFRKEDMTIKIVGKPFDLIDLIELVKSMIN